MESGSMEDRDLPDGEMVGPPRGPATRSPRPHARTPPHHRITRAPAIARVFSSTTPGSLLAYIIVIAPARHLLLCSVSCAGSMEMRWAPTRPRPRHQPSFSSTLLDAICDSMDEPGATRTAAAKKQQEAALQYRYYKPSLAASHRAREPPTPGTASGADCPGRGYFSSSEVESSLRRLRPIRTSGPGGGGAALPPQKQQPAAPEKARAAKKLAASSRGGCSRPASPGARLASLLNSIFSGKRSSVQRQTAPADQEPACSTAPSYARSCLAKAATTAEARASRSRSTRTVRFLDIDGEVAVAAAAVGSSRRIPVVEVEEVLLRPVDVEANRDGGGEESSDASSDLFELKDLPAVAPASSRGNRSGAYLDELPVYGTTGVGLRRGIGHARAYENGLCRSCRKVI